MGGKKGGGQAAPYIHPNTLESKQKIRLMHLISAGTINGWQNDTLLKSIKFNDTYVQNKDGSFNFNNVKASFLAGSLDQDYLAGFDGIERSISVGAQVKKSTPVTRSITDKMVGSLRVTLGVPSLMWQFMGNVFGTDVSVDVQIVKNGAVYTSKNWSLFEKGNSNFKQDVVIDDLPEAPFDLKIIRNTPDSTSDDLKNDTFFHSYVEIIPRKFSYPSCAVIGLELDAEQLGGQVPTINYDVLGREVRVPSNYDPVKRSYTGLWDGSFKAAYTNNPAWVLYDVLTEKIHGLGRYYNEAIIDRMKLYEIGKYADVMVDDGEGGKEPRYVFNGLIQGNSAMTIIDNLCSVFRGRAIEKNGFISFIYDKGNEKPVAIYTNANTVNGQFLYTHAPLDTRINSVHFEYADERDGCKLKVEEVSNQESIARLGRINTQKITCYGQTKRSAALRQALYILDTSATEAESVTFKVGFEGIKHGAFDIIAIADNNKAGVMIGGRVLSAQDNTVKLDRDIADAREIRIKDMLYTVIKQLSSDTYQLDKPVIADAYSVFSANTNKATERLFKVISTEENKDGSYSISAVKYNAKKMGGIDDGVSRFPEITTSYNNNPVLTDGSIANRGDYLLLTWDSLASVGTEITYTIQLLKDNKPYRTYTTKEPSLKLYDLPMGDYIARIKGRTSTGIYSQELVVPFSTTYIINNLSYKPIAFGISLSWITPPLINNKASIEVWISDNDTDFRKYATLAYPTQNHEINNLSAGDELYVKVRIVDDNLNQGEFTGSILAKASTDSDSMLSYLDGKISEKEISKELQDQFDQNITDKVNEVKDEINNSIDADISGVNKEIDGIKDGINGINTNIDGIEGDIATTNSNVENVKKDADKALKDAEKNAEDIKSQATVIDEVKVSQGESEALWQLSQLSNVSSQKSNFARINSTSGQVGLNIAKIEQIDSFVIEEQQATATRFTQINTRVDGAESKITNVQNSLSSDIEAEASKREALEAVFDLSKAGQQLQLMTQSTADTALSSRLLTLSASTANAQSEITRLDEAIATNEGASSKAIAELKSEVDGNSASIKRIDSTIATDKENQALVNTSLKSDIDGNTSSIDSFKTTYSNDKEAQATVNTDLKSEIDGNEANQRLSSMTQATNDKSLSQRYSSVSASTANAQASIERLDKVVVDGNKAQATINQNLKAEIESSQGEIKRVEGIVVSNKDAQAIINTDVELGFENNKVNQQLSSLSQVSGDKASSQMISSLSVAVGDSTASIDQLDKVVSDEKKSTAERFVQINSRVGDTESSISQIASTQVDTNGKVNAMYTLKVDANGNVGGIMLGANEKESMFKVAADSFVVSTPDQSKNMFTLQQVGGKTVAAINGDLIAKGSISGDKITANTSIQAPVIKGGRVESGHFAGGSINIGNGNFSVDSGGNLIAKSGRFEGTIYANKIEGPLGIIHRLPEVNYQPIILNDRRPYVMDFGTAQWERSLVVMSALDIKHIFAADKRLNEFQLYAIRNGNRELLKDFGSVFEFNVLSIGEMFNIPAWQNFKLELLQSYIGSSYSQGAKSNGFQIQDVRATINNMQWS